jgi:GrpB-like predicted nucleotidyltransferase (UPF0157 family)
MAEPDREASIVVPPQRLDGPIQLCAYSNKWPVQFRAQRQRIRTALGGRVLLLEHIGSTSVPGLAAKPIIDVCLAVADTTDEASYVPSLEAVGFVLHIREPEWYEHRLLKHHDPPTNLHVFPVNAAEIRRCLLFRDWLRSNHEDRARYESTKQDLAARRWDYVQSYADAKTDVIAAIIARAEAGQVRSP